MIEKAIAGKRYQVDCSVNSDVYPELRKGEVMVALETGSNFPFMVREKDYVPGQHINDYEKRYALSVCDLFDITQLFEQAEEALELYHNTPNGEVTDADTILADIVESLDFMEIGIGEEIINIWKNSTDKKSVEDLFYSFTGVTFEDYIKRCISDTTRNTNFEEERGDDR